MRQSKHRRRLRYAIVRTASALAVILLGTAVAGGSPQAAVPCGGTWWVDPDNLALDQPLPEFGFSTCDGEELTTADFQGQPLLINFWATWCAPCVRELPNFSALHEEQGDSVAVLGVSVDQDAGRVKGFLSDNPLPYTLAWDSDGIAGDLGFNSIPVTLAVDAEGKLVAVHRGYASERELKELLAVAQRSAAADDEEAAADVNEGSAAAGADKEAPREGLDVGGSD